MAETIFQKPLDAQVALNTDAITNINTAMTSNSAVVDANNILTNSFYRTSGGSTNLPDSNTSGVLETKVAIPGQVVKQTYTLYTGRTHARVYWYGSWSTWTEL